MTPTVQSVKEEQEQFLPYLEEIRKVADLIGRVRSSRCSAGSERSTSSWPTD